MDLLYSKWTKDRMAKLFVLVADFMFNFIPE